MKHQRDETNYKRKKKSYFKYAVDMNSSLRPAAVEGFAQRTNTAILCKREKQRLIVQQSGHLMLVCGLHDVVKHFTP